MEKSHVSLDTKICSVCTEKHVVGLLFDTRLKNTFEKNTVTGWGLCKECKTHTENGFVAFIAIDPAKSKLLPNGNTSLDGAYRLGKIAWMKQALAEDVVGSDIQSINFADEKLLDEMEKWKNEANMVNGSDDVAVSDSKP
jgi:hypothetical protein